MYSFFADCYDQLMDNIPYDDWSSYLCDILKKHNIDKGLVCELGCGTGNITRRLKKSGYDMIGIDNSENMLDVAKSKKNSEDILYLRQDMREFELYGTVAAVVSICDSINYITDTEDLITVFKLVNNYLDPKGIFVFDFNTRHYYKDVVADSTIAEDREEISFIWDNYYDVDEDINELSLSIFALVDKQNMLYQKHEEFHLQRGYTLAEMKDIIKCSGLEMVAAYNAFTYEEADENCERIYMIARESGKKSV